MDKLFSVRVRVTDAFTVESPRGKICQLSFTGDCSCDFFRGRILPGGVDTQFFLPGEPGLLSARYMLEGTDCAGEPARIFIENTAVSGGPTRPRIWTDSRALAWLEEETYRGTVRPDGEELLICFEPAEREDV